MDLELEIKQHDEIYLPIEIGSTFLTLEEIGAIVLLMCLQRGNGSDELAENMKTPEFEKAVHRMRERDVLTMNVHGECLSIGIDLDPVLLDDENEEDGD